MVKDGDKKKDGFYKDCGNKDEWLNVNVKGEKLDQSEHCWLW